MYESYFAQKALGQAMLADAYTRQIRRNQEDPEYQESLRRFWAERAEQERQRQKAERAEQERQRQKAERAEQERQRQKAEWAEQERQRQEAKRAAMALGGLGVAIAAGVAVWKAYHRPAGNDPLDAEQQPRVQEEAER